MSVEKKKNDEMLLFDNIMGCCEGNFDLFSFLVC